MTWDLKNRTRFESGCIAFHLRHARANLAALKPGHSEDFRNESQYGMPMMHGGLHVEDDIAWSMPVNAPAAVAGETGAQLGEALETISASLHEELRGFLHSFSRRLSAREEALSAACDRASAATDQGISEMSRRLEARLADEQRRTADEREAALEIIRATQRELRERLAATQARVESVVAGEDFGAQLQAACRGFDQRVNPKLETLERRWEETRLAEAAKQRAWRETVDQRCDALEKRAAKNRKAAEGIVEQVTKMMPDVQVVQDLCEQLHVERENFAAWQRRITACESSASRTSMLETRLSALEKQTVVALEEQAQKLRESCHSTGCMSAQIGRLDSSLKSLDSQWRSTDQRLTACVEQYATRFRSTQDSLRESIVQRFADCDTRQQHRLERFRQSVERQIEETLQLHALRAARSATTQARSPARTGPVAASSQDIHAAGERRRSCSPSPSPERSPAAASPSAIALASRAYSTAAEVVHRPSFDVSLASYSSRAARPSRAIPPALDATLFSPDASPSGTIDSPARVRGRAGSADGRQSVAASDRPPSTRTEDLHPGSAHESPLPSATPPAAASPQSRSVVEAPSELGIPPATPQAAAATVVHQPFGLEVRSAPVAQQLPVSPSMEYFERLPSRQSSAQSVQSTPAAALPSSAAPSIDYFEELASRPSSQRGSVRSTPAAQPAPAAERPASRQSIQPKPSSAQSSPVAHSPLLASPSSVVAAERRPSRQSSQRSAARSSPAAQHAAAAASPSSAAVAAAAERLPSWQSTPHSVADDAPVGLPPATPLHDAAATSLDPGSDSPEALGPPPASQGQGQESTVAGLRGGMATPPASSDEEEEDVEALMQQSMRAAHTQPHPLLEHTGSSVDKPPLTAIALDSHLAAGSEGGDTDGLAAPMSSTAFTALAEPPQSGPPVQGTSSAEYAAAMFGEEDSDEDVEALLQRSMQSGAARTRPEAPAQAAQPSSVMSTVPLEESDDEDEDVEALLARALQPRSSPDPGPVDAPPPQARAQPPPAAAAVHDQSYTATAGAGLADGESDDEDDIEAMLAKSMQRSPKAGQQPGRSTLASRRLGLSSTSGAQVITRRSC
eukprot:TRINITY_DN72686_c0_g1_i1.p1 TRINITY_DN72686_c0_g1~~TRINITY_DN72686_c0_g1_i1.p1  ORF type:complete len:1087 (+),score=244.12 TRINITY_DN72686_c0_g1_i1:93-3353(+)